MQQIQDLSKKLGLYFISKQRSINQEANSLVEKRDPSFVKNVEEFLHLDFLVVRLFSGFMFWCINWLGINFTPFPCFQKISPALYFFLSANTQNSYFPSKNKNNNTDKSLISYNLVVFKLP